MSLFENLIFIKITKNTDISHIYRLFNFGIIATIAKLISYVQKHPTSSELMNKSSAQTKLLSVHGTP